MQSSLSVNNIQPSFQATVSKHFIDDAHKLMESKFRKPGIRVDFDEKVTEFLNYGYDDYFIKYVKKDINGKRFHQLIAVRSGMDDSEGAVLTSKDKFRKTVEKFTHINKHEFNMKMKQYLQRKFPMIKPAEV